MDELSGGKPTGHDAKLEKRAMGRQDRAERDVRFELLGEQLPRLAVAQEAEGDEDERGGGHQRGEGGDGGVDDVEA